MLGTGGGSDEMWKTMPETKMTYMQLKSTLQEFGINAFIFAFKLLVHKNEALLMTKDKQVKALLCSKLAF